MFVQSCGEAALGVTHGGPFAAHGGRVAAHGGPFAAHGGRFAAHGGRFAAHGAAREPFAAFPCGGQTRSTHWVQGGGD